MGDTVLVLNEREAVPIVWIGQRVVNCARHLRPEQVWPVRIRAGAFGSARPCRDLLLSPDHAVYVDVDTEDGVPGVLIPVRLLINGGSIAQVKMDQVTYYHVELPRHDVVLAEGLPAESYLDTGNRGNFANAGGAVALHPDFASLTWDAAGCAPLVVTGPRLEAVRRRLAERADGNMPGAAPGRDGMDHDPQRRKARLSRRAGSGVRESRRG